MAKANAVRESRGDEEEENRRGKGAERKRCGEEQVLSRKGDKNERRRRRAVFTEGHSRCVQAGSACVSRGLPSYRPWSYLCEKFDCFASVLDTTNHSHCQKHTR